MWCVNCPRTLELSITHVRVAGVEQRVLAADRRHAPQSIGPRTCAPLRLRSHTVTEAATHLSTYPTLPKMLRQLRVHSLTPT